MGNLLLSIKICWWNHKFFVISVFLHSGNKFWPSKLHEFYEKWYAREFKGKRLTNLFRFWDKNSEINISFDLRELTDFDFATMEFEQKYVSCLKIWIHILNFLIASNTFSSLCRLLCWKIQKSSSVMRQKRKSKHKIDALLIFWYDWRQRKFKTDEGFSLLVSVPSKFHQMQSFLHILTSS